MRMRTIRKLCVLASVVGAFTLFGAITAPAASAATDTARRGQCGGAVYNWQGYINNLSMYGGVQQAAEINRSAGYSSTDGSFTQWMKERVIVTRLAAPATITNYGCNSSGVFAAGKKRLSKGWPVLVALPDRYSKSDIRMKPTRGYKAIVVKVRLVGQATCANPGKAIVKIVIHVKVKVKLKPKVKPKPKPKPAPPVSPLCITTTGVPLYSIPSGITVVNGVCTTVVVTTTTTQECKAGEVRNSNNVCVNNTNVNTNTNTVTVPVTVIVSPPAGCTTCTPVVVTPPTCPPGQTGTPPNCTTPPPPPPPANRPPTGQIKPPQHVYVNGQTPVCVDNVTDPDGDQVSVSFSFTAGSAISSVFTQPGGAVCVTYKAPDTPQEVTVTATLSDGRGGSVTLLDNFPVIPDQY